MSQQKTRESASRNQQVHIVTTKDLALSSDHKRAIKPESFALAVRVLLQNWRQGTVACKDRSEVAYTNKKPWKQKGTGRARAGTRRSPLWRGGGVTFGPQERVRTLSIPRKMRQGIFNGLLWNRLDAERIIALPWNSEQAMPKTSAAYSALKNAGLHDKKVTLFVMVDNYLVQSSFANLPNVQMLFFDQPNAYALAYGDYWVFLQQDHESFKEMVSSWI